MSWDFQVVELFLLHFSQACCIESHKLLNGWHDFTFQAQPNTSLFALGSSKDRIILHGVHLFEQIDQEKGYTPKFQKDCGNALQKGGINVGLRGRNKHFQAFALDVHKERPLMSLWCSLNWDLDSDTETAMNGVVRGLRDDHSLTVESRKNDVPRQLENECAARALGDVFELVLRLSNGHEGLERDQQFATARRNRRGGGARQIQAETNAQGERLRMFMLLWILNGMSKARPTKLYPDFKKTLAHAKATASLPTIRRRRTPDQGPVTVDLLAQSPAAKPSAAGAAAAGGRGARRQVLPHHLRQPTHELTTFL